MKTFPFRTLLFLSITVGLFCAASSQSRAENPAALPAYEPGAAIAGTLRIWGDEYMSAVVKYWAEGFKKYHPQIKVEAQLLGTATAMPSLYLGAGDLALFGRETNVTDNDGFLHNMQYRPLQLELMNGSLDVPGKSYALAIFVHKDNPLSQLTLPQLDAIFGCEHLRGLANIRTWGQLGLDGDWKDKPIHLYGYNVETGTGMFFLHTVLLDSRKMYWDQLKEFKDIKNPDGSKYESGQQIIDVMQNDRYGIAVSSVRYANPEVKAIALAAKEGSPYYQATREAIVSRQYPLSRQTYAFVNRPPGMPVDPKVKEFLRYVLSREGQEDVSRDHGYLPLSNEILAEQLKKLE